MATTERNEKGVYFINLPSVQNLERPSRIIISLSNAAVFTAKVMVYIVSNSPLYHTPQDVYLVKGSRIVHRVHRHWKNVTWGGLV